MTIKRVTTKCLMDEITRLRRWVHDLQTGLYVNCVYCGHQYAPKAGRDVLTAHIKQCPEHPLAAALERIKELEDENRTLRPGCEE